MVNLSSINEAWPSEDCVPNLCAAVKAMGVRGLPIQKALTQGNVALDDDMMVRVLNMEEKDDRLIFIIGIQYTSIVTGCSCLDDPSSLNILPEYCETALEIDRRTGETEIRLL